MTRCTAYDFNPETLRIVNSFSILADCPVPGPANLKKCLGLWSNSWINNDMRQFLYLLRNNGLMLNNRLNAIDETVSPYCTFCRIIDRASAERDGFLHFFRNGPVGLINFQFFTNFDLRHASCGSQGYKNLQKFFSFFFSQKP